MSSIVQHAPKFTEDDAIRIGNKLFGFDGTAESLPSERDQNFRLTTAADKSFVLKIANSTEPMRVLEFQNQAMLHIRDNLDSKKPDIAVAPQVCLSVNGKQISLVRGDDGTPYPVRLLTYLPGKPLALVRPHNFKLMVSLGRFFGQLDQILQGFDHPGAHRDFHWDLKNAGRVITQYMGLIKDAPAAENCAAIARTLSG